MIALDLNTEHRVAIVSIPITLPVGLFGVQIKINLTFLLALLTIASTSNEHDFFLRWAAFCYK
jgi:hypothetical protein